jgi:hypothetical protein
MLPCADDAGRGPPSRGIACAGSRPAAHPAGIVEQAPNHIRILWHLIDQRIELGAVFEIACGDRCPDVGLKLRGPGVVGGAHPGGIRHRIDASLDALASLPTVFVVPPGRAIAHDHHAAVRVLCSGQLRSVCAQSRHPLAPSRPLRIAIHHFGAEGLQGESACSRMATRDNSRGAGVAVFLALVVASATEPSGAQGGLSYCRGDAAGPLQELPR